MSEAKDRYEELLIMCPEFSKFEITNYVKELEKINNELTESLKNELKAEYVFGKYDNFSMFKFNNKKKIDLFEKATGLKIEEVIK